MNQKTRDGNTLETLFGQLQAFDWVMVNQPRGVPDAIPVAVHDDVSDAVPDAVHGAIPVQQSWVLFCAQIVLRPGLAICTSSYPRANLGLGVQSTGPRLTSFVSRKNFPCNTPQCCLVLLVVSVKIVRS